MNNTVSLQQKSQTGHLERNFLLRPYKLDLMARFMEIKSINPKVKQSEIAKELGCSSCTLQRYRIDKKLLSPYRIPTNSYKRKRKFSNRELDLETSNDLKRPQLTPKKSSPKIETVQSKKNKLKGGANIEVTDS